MFDDDMPVPYESGVPIGSVLGHPSTQRIVSVRPSLSHWVGNASQLVERVPVETPIPGFVPIGTRYPDQAPGRVIFMFPARLGKDAPVFPDSDRPSRRSPGFDALQVAGIIVFEVFDRAVRISGACQGSEVGVVETAGSAAGIRYGGYPAFVVEAELSLVR